jgi:predicted peptidase
VLGWPLRALIGVVLIVGGCRDTMVGASGTPPSGGPPPPPPQAVGFVKHTLTDSGVTYAYQVFVPLNYDPKRLWPVILFLHGSGQAGTDNELQTLVGLGPAVRAQQKDFPAIVVFPQAPKGVRWQRTMGRVAIEALDETVQQLHGDSTREYLTGVSLGGFGTWELALEYPDRFAALVPIAGAIHAKCSCPTCHPLIAAVPPNTPDPYAYVAQKLQRMPIWVFHGSADPQVPVVEARQIVAALRAVGAPVRYTEYPGVGHDAWDQAYADPALWTWLFAQLTIP